MQFNSESYQHITYPYSNNFSLLNQWKWLTFHRVQGCKFAISGDIFLKYGLKDNCTCTDSLFLSIYLWLFPDIIYNHISLKHRKWGCMSPHSLHITDCNYMRQSWRTKSPSSRIYYSHKKKDAQLNTTGIMSKNLCHWAISSQHWLVNKKIILLLEHSFPNQCLTLLLLMII